MACPIFNINDNVVFRYCIVFIWSRTAYDDDADDGAEMRTTCLRGCFGNPKNSLYEHNILKLLK